MIASAALTHPVLAFSVPGFVLVEGTITGLSYGLLALGLVLIYRTNRVLNFSQGQLGVVGAVFMVKCFYDFGINYWAALVFALALAAAVGAASELVLRRLFKRPRVLVMVATIGLAQVLYLFTVLPFVRPAKLTQPFPVPFHPSFTLDGFVFGPGQVITLVVAPLVALALGAVHPVLALGPGHAGHGRERGLGPPVGGVGAPDLHHHLDHRRACCRRPPPSSTPRARPRA